MNDLEVEPEGVLRPHAHPGRPLAPDLGARGRMGQDVGGLVRELLLGLKQRYFGQNCLT